MRPLVPAKTGTCATASYAGKYLFRGLPAGHTAAAARRAGADPARTATAIARATVTGRRPHYRRGISERMNAGRTALLVLRAGRQRQSSQYKRCSTHCQNELLHRTLLLMAGLLEEKTPAKRSLGRVCCIVFAGTATFTALLNRHSFESSKISHVAV